MSGHNKWSQIKHKKGASDAKKGKVFGKLVRLISIAARNNPDPRANPQLKSTIDQAREVNMPNDNIERAIKKVSDKDSAQLEELQLEALGPGGSALIITAISDNRNRTIGEIKALLAKLDAKLVNQGSLAWMFAKVGMEWAATSPITLSDEDLVKFEKILEALDDHDDVQDVFTNLQ
jgi:YebC/PmpR family DNA-binding regulatory protein